MRTSIGLSNAADGGCEPHGYHLVRYACIGSHILKGRPRRIAIVAMARKLLVALWRYLQTGVIPTGAELKA